MIEQLLSKRNLNKAFLKVYENEGSSGVDGIEVEHLYSLLQQNGHHYANQIREGSYEVSAILGVEIEKLTGGMRLLGIPTVLDRTFQLGLMPSIRPDVRARISTTQLWIPPQSQCSPSCNAKPE